MSKYFDEIRKEFPEIVPFEEDDNILWENEGYKLLRSDNYKEAEVRFKKVMLAQPEHHAGYEGLAYIYYYFNEYEKALWFMEKALEIAKGFYEDGSLDIEVLEDIEFNYDAINKKESIGKWWSKNK
ncbi:MAG: tetratricopeptide repeat protein [Ignavibacteria bacterium]|nr:tetratricopeptide repeat protein [Ignavibacteria bacterium]